MSSARYQLNVPWGLGDGAGTLSAGGSDIGLDMGADDGDEKITSPSLQQGPAPTAEPHGSPQAGPHAGPWAGPQAGAPTGAYAGACDMPHGSARRPQGEPNSMNEGRRQLDPPPKQLLQPGAAARPSTTNDRHIKRDIRDFSGAGGRERPGTRGASSPTTPPET